MEDGKKMKILYEDNHLIVVVKDYNIPVQEDSSKDKDLFSMIKEYIKEKYNKPGNVYLGLIHRLDRPVGGVMVFAKTSKAASRLSEQFRLHNVEKRYMALVHGKAKEHDVLVNRLLKNEKTNTSFVTDEGKEAKLEYNLLEYRNGMSLIDINLYTGRHHQIRVQLSYNNHPIYGDQRYGKANEKVQIHLWAYKLKFKHPVKDEVLEFIEYPDFK